MFSTISPHDSGRPNTSRAKESISNSFNDKQASQERRKSPIRPASAVSPRPSSYFEVDKYATELIRGKKSLVHGLAIPCAWSWCDNDPETEAKYQELVTNVRELAAKYPGTRNKFFCYNKSTLHCTIATLFSFKEVTPISEEIHAPAGADPLAVATPQLKRSRIFEVWGEVLSDQMTRPCHRLRMCSDTPSPSSVSLEVSKIEVSQGACVIHFVDKLNLIAHLRSLVQAASEDPRLRRLEEELCLPDRSLSSYISIPNIIHSTFARYDKVTFRSTEEEAAFLSELLALCESCSLVSQPATVSAGSFHLVHEYHPYMQMPKMSRLGGACVSGGSSGGCVVTSPIIASFQMLDMLLDTASDVPAPAPSPSPVRSTRPQSSTPGNAVDENELTLTPLSPMYHKYIHPSEEKNAGGGNTNDTPFKLSSDLGDESELFLTPLSDQLGSAARSTDSGMQLMSPGGGGDDGDVGSHLESLVSGSALLSPTIGSPSVTKAAQRRTAAKKKSAVVASPKTTVDSATSTAPPTKDDFTAGSSSSNSWSAWLCGGALLASAGLSAYVWTYHRKAAQQAIDLWAARLVEWTKTTPRLV